MRWNIENCVIVTIGGQNVLIDWHKLKRTGLKECAVDGGRRDSLKRIKEKQKRERARPRISWQTTKLVRCIESGTGGI